MLVLTQPYAIHVICGFIVSFQVKLSALLKTEFLCAVNVPVRSYLLLLHPLRKLTTGMTNFKSNPTSKMLVMRLTNVLVVLTQSLYVLLHRGKHSENCYLSSPTMQSEQNFGGMPATLAFYLLIYLFAFLKVYQTVHSINN